MSLSTVVTDVNIQLVIFFSVLLMLLFSDLLLLESSPSNSSGIKRHFMYADNIKTNYIYVFGYIYVTHIFVLGNLQLFHLHQCRHAIHHIVTVFVNGPLNTLHSHVYLL